MSKMRSIRILMGIAAGWILSSGSSFSQPLSCSVTTSALKFRAAGTADLMGDVIFQCVPGPRPVSGQSYISGDVTIFINTNVTSRLTGNGDSDAVLVINENHTMPSHTSTLGGPDKNLPVPQFGHICGANCLQWSGVQIPAPGGTARDGTTFASRTTLRITNMRLSGGQLGVSSTLTPTQVVLFGAGIADAAQIQGVDGLQLLGSVTPALRTTVSPGTLCSDQTQNIVNGAVSGPPTFSVRFIESFEYAFRPLGQPSSSRGIPAGESGYPTPGFGTNGGSADQGTRLMLRINNVGTGVRLAVPRQITQGTLSLQLLQGVDFSGGGKSTPVTGSGLAELPGSFGAFQAVYEVVASDNTLIEVVDVPVTVGFTADPAKNLPGIGVATVNASLAPLSTTFTASTSAPLPRFLDDSSARIAFLVGPTCIPPATVTSVVPSSITAGSGNDLVIGVAGTGFGFTSTVEFNGVLLNTELTSDFNGLFATVPANLLAPAGTAMVDVLNPDGKRSNSMAFTIVSASETESQGKSKR